MFLHDEASDPETYPTPCAVAKVQTSAWGRGRMDGLTAPQESHRLQKATPPYSLAL